MKTVRVQTLGFLMISLAIVCVAWWGCSKKTSDENPNANNTPPAATDTAGTGEVSLAVGNRVFKERCELCHGPEGKGDGPGGVNLTPKPRDFHDKAYMSKIGDQQWHDTIVNGKAGTGMPPWKGILTESEIQSVMLKEKSFSR